MRSILAITSVALLGLPAIALAEWTPLGVENEIFTAYVDRESIRRQDGVVHMAGMYDFRKQDFTPEGQGLYSTVVLREYDCAKRLVRMLSYIDFVGHKGEGGVVSQAKRAGRWEAVLEGGVDDAYWRVACAPS
jgi:hypothetical protein